MLESAVANAKYLKNVEPASLFVKEIRVDQGSTYKYFKPGAMGRSQAYKRRTSHASVILESVAKIEE